MPPRRLAHYDVGAQLGAGGMGEVYRAHDLHLDRDIALKILPAETAGDPSRLARFAAEARTLAALNHSSIVTVHSVEEHEGVHFLTMELVEGHRLDSIIPPRGMSRRLFFDIALPLADALSAAHRKGIVHRDLKPANVMITSEGQVKVLDFGLALREGMPDLPGGNGSPEPSPDRTADGTVIGTVPYMAPEQIRGESADPRSDIFSLGVMLFEMATGERPFVGDTPARTARAILDERPPGVTALRPDLPASVARIIASCLEKDRGLRPSSTLALARDLEASAREGEEGATAVPSIAVLPFVDMSPERDQEHFCEGIAEELINDLARVTRMRVASRTSAFLFKETGLDIREIGRRLGVDTVLEGSVRKSGETVRITAQLIDVADGYHLWSDRYDRRVSDVFRVQDEIAESIVAALQVTLTPGERRSMASVPTTSTEAHDYYLRGRRFFYQYRRRGVELALEMFSLAIRHDPHYALAYAGIADCSCYLHLYADHSAESLRKADAASRRALDLDPDLANAHVSRGWFHSLSGRHEEAERHFETAVRLGPRLFEAHYLYARDAFAQGKLERAAELFERASALSPEDYQSPLLVAGIYAQLGREADAAAARRRGVEIVERHLQFHPGDVRALYMGANGLVALGETDRAREWAALARMMDPDEPMVLYNVACVLAMAGHTDEALDSLEAAVRAGLTQRDWIVHDSDLTSLRGHPRFAAIMAEVDRLLAPAPNGPAPDAYVNGAGPDD